MRLSQLNTDKALDVMSEVTPHLLSIVNDKTILGILNEKSGFPKDASEEEIKQLAFERGISIVTRLVPVLLREHKNDVLNILAIINQKTYDEVADQTIMVTISQLKELINDREFIDFLLLTKR